MTRDIVITDYFRPCIFFDNEEELQAFVKAAEAGKKCQPPALPVRGALPKLASSQVRQMPDPRP